jgi:hypothetical protein
VLLILICDVAYIVLTTEQEEAECGGVEGFLQATEAVGWVSGLPASCVCVLVGAGCAL